MNSNWDICSRYQWWTGCVSMGWSLQLNLKGCTPENYRLSSFPVVYTHTHARTHSRTHRPSVILRVIQTVKGIKYIPVSLFNTVVLFDPVKHFLSTECFSFTHGSFLLEWAFFLTQMHKRWKGTLIWQCYVFYCHMKLVCLLTFDVFGFYFRTLAVILVSDFLFCFYPSLSLSLSLSLYIYIYIYIYINLERWQSTINTEICVEQS